MLKKNCLFLIIFALFLFVACNNTDEPSIETSLTIEKEYATNGEFPTEDENITEPESDDEIDPAVASNIHEVLANETLFSISQMHNISVEVLQQANNLDTTELQIGQLLRIPPEGSELLQEIQFTLTELSENDLSSLDYNLIVYLDHPGGRNFLIETENTLHDLQIVELRLDLPFLEVIFTHESPGDFNLSGEASSLLIRNNMDVGTAISTGLRFIDDHGVERTFIFGFSNKTGESHIEDRTHFSN